MVFIAEIHDRSTFYIFQNYNVWTAGQVIIMNSLLSSQFICLPICKSSSSGSSNTWFKRTMFGWLKSDKMLISNISLGFRWCDKSRRLFAEEAWLGPVDLDVERSASLVLFLERGPAICSKLYRCCCKSLDFLRDLTAYRVLSYRFFKEAVHVNLPLTNFACVHFSTAK